jgi:hypothetical protein
MAHPGFDRLDDELRPTVVALHAETETLLGLARQIYVPSRVADTVIGEVLTPQQQLLLYVVSAHVALSSLFCQRRLNNEPVSDALRDQIARVQQYIGRLKAHGVDVSGGIAGGGAPKPSHARQALDALGEKRPRPVTATAAAAAAAASAAAPAAAAQPSAGARRQRGDAEAPDESTTIDVEPVEPSNAAASARQRRVDPQAAANVARMQLQPPRQSKSK